MLMPRESARCFDIQATVVIHPHSDPSWKWPREEGLAWIHKGFLKIVTVINQHARQLQELEAGLARGETVDPQALEKERFLNRFVIASGCSEFYEYVEAQDPELFAQIQSLVKQGRWEIVGGTFNEPDENKPAGEFLARQFVLGKRYFLDRFGVDVTVGANVDAFGHPELWEILAEAGIEGFVVLRPRPHQAGYESRLTRHFAASGKSVLVFRLARRYDTSPGDICQLLFNGLDEADAASGQMLTFIGQGDHVTGLDEQNLDSVWQLHQQGYPIDFGTTAGYFAAVQQLEKTGRFIPPGPPEMQADAPGAWSNELVGNCLLVQAEAGYLLAESACLLSLLLADRPYPAQALQAALKTILNVDFHDTASFTGTAEVTRQTKRYLLEATQACKDLLGAALRPLTRRTDTLASPPLPEGEALLAEQPFVVWNLGCPWPVTSWVRLELLRAFREGDYVVDANGSRVPFQVIEPESGCLNDADLLVRVSLPALGYTTLWVRSLSSGPTAPLAQLPEPPDLALENEFYCLRFDPSSGHISVTDKRLGGEVIIGGSDLVVLEDLGDAWGHNLNTPGPILGHFQKTGAAFLENGPLEQIVRVTCEYKDEQGGLSIVYLDYRLRQGSDRITLELRPYIAPTLVHKMVKLVYPLNIDEDQLYARSPGYRVQRAFNGLEAPMQDFLQVQGLLRTKKHQAPHCTVELHAPGCFAYNAHKDARYLEPGQPFNTLPPNYFVGLTLWRNVIADHHAPNSFAYLKHPTVLNQGCLSDPTILEKPLTCTIRVALGPAGSEAFRVSRELRQPPVVMRETGHSGSLPPAGTFLALSDGLDLWAFKRAEDGAGLILRLHNPGRPAVAGFALNVPGMSRRLSHAFLRGQLVTLKIPFNPEASIVITDIPEIVEQPL